jgi:ribonuclease P protein component
LVKAGKRRQDPMFQVYVRPNQLEHARLGITVSRRVSLKAVERNRIKRQVREAFRGQTTLAGLDIVVIARAAAAASSGPALRESLRKHWQTIIHQCRPSSSP